MTGERDTMPTCPKCEGAGVLSEERGTGYFVGSCDLCDSLGVVSLEKHRAYRAEQAARARPRGAS